MLATPSLQPANSRPGSATAESLIGTPENITSVASLGNLKRWRDEVRHAVPGVPFVVVGNKVDLERSVRMELARRAANYLGAPYLETSALTGQGVAALFETLAVLAAGARFG